MRAFAAVAAVVLLTAAFLVGWVGRNYNRERSLPRKAPAARQQHQPDVQQVPQ